MNALLSKSEVSRDGQHSLFEIRLRGDQSKYRWYEAYLYYVDSIDGVSEDIILTFFDMDEIIRIKKQHEVRNSNNQLIEVLSSVVESRMWNQKPHLRIKDMTNLSERNNESYRSTLYEGK
jgi:hypothetical protein